MAITEIRVRYKDRDVKGEAVQYEAQRTMKIDGLNEIKTAKVYRLEGINESQAEKLQKTLFCESIDQESVINQPLIKDASHVIEVAYQPGVMNPESSSIIKAAKDIGIEVVAVDSSFEYGFYGDLTREDIDRVVHALLVNKTVERVVYEKPKTLLIKGEVGLISKIAIRQASDQDLIALSKDKLFLDLNEMKTIQKHFNDLDHDPTDCELEIIAARWSEHCGHKTFKAKVIIDGVEKPPLFTRISETAKKYFGNEVISAFEDNSGVIKFFDGMAICGKVETHNSPSAIEPYGGAMTGSGGVFRDILGTGQGAKIIASTDIFCFAPPDLDVTKLPAGTLHPDYLQRRVVAGVRDYGNRMGIPTNNGSVHYHEDFRAKPTIIVGSYGLISEDKAEKGKPETGDLVVVVGGKTGRDGIHGATFSSGEMTERTVSVNSSAVQIGNAIEEKRMTDAILEATSKGIIRAITDCGAAGLSSAVGEMGEDIGVKVDIKKVPLKYSGLAPWEIWLSESQERMVLAIPFEKNPEFLKICEKFNVEATVLGEFDGTNELTVNYGDENVAKLDFEFLKNGLPKKTMFAHFEKKKSVELKPNLPTNWVETLQKVMSHGNVASKEPIIRQYDHGVQGTNVLPPFSGKNFDGPNDAVVLTPILEKSYGMVISHGLNPVLNTIDPYWGSLWAVAEATANYVAVGGDPDVASLINNYIWPYPDEESFASLDRSVDAVVDAMNALKRPVISGKDSLSSTYRGKNGEVIKIPPVLCISVMGKISDIENTLTSNIQEAGSTLCLVGKLDRGMGGSVYYDINGATGEDVPKVDLMLLPKVLKTVHNGIKKGKILSAHDVSEGGVIAAVVEMAFGGDCGTNLKLEKIQRPDLFLFNETAGCFILEVKDEKTAKKLFDKVPYLILGKTKKEKEITVSNGQKRLFSIVTDELKDVWQSPLRRIFP